MKTIQGYITGRVQGVGFRYFIKQQAHSAGVFGYARNLTDGSVEFLLQGEEEAVQHVLDMIHHGPAMASVEKVDVQEFDAANRLVDFEVS